MTLYLFFTLSLLLFHIHISILIPSLSLFSILKGLTLEYQQLLFLSLFSSFPRVLKHVYLLQNVNFLVARFERNARELGRCFHPRIEGQFLENNRYMYTQSRFRDRHYRRIARARTLIERDRLAEVTFNDDDD